MKYFKFIKTLYRCGPRDRKNNVVLEWLTTRWKCSILYT